MRVARSELKKIDVEENVWNLILNNFAKNIFFGAGVHVPIFYNQVSEISWCERCRTKSILL